MSYNFSELQRCMGALKSKVNASTLRDLKNELNRFFKDSECMEVIYTTNNDRSFFGMSVLPVLPENYFLKLRSGDFVRFEKYILEIDSKLLSSLLALTEAELTAIVLHEVGHVVNNVAVSRQISDFVNVAITKHGVKLNVEDSYKIAKFTDFAIYKSIRKAVSIFEKNDEEYIADTFVVQCGYGAHLESAYNKIIKSRESLSNDKNKFLTMVWALTMMKELYPRRRSILKQLDTFEDIESSRLIRDRIKSAKDAIRNFYDPTAIHEAMYKDRATRYLNENKFFKSLKYSMLKTIEDDLYEFNIRMKNIDNEVEAMDLLRSMNMRIALIEEYIAKEAPPKQDSERLTALANKFRFMRDELVKKAEYHDTSYGLFVKM